QAGRNARPGRGAVYLAVGEDTDIGAVMARFAGRPDQDRAIEKAQIRLEGMLDGVGGVYGGFDGSPQLDQAAKRLVLQAFQAQALDRHDGVKGSTKGNIYLDLIVLPEKAALDRQVSQVQERRHVQERNLSHPARSGVVMGGSPNQAGRSIQGDGSLGAARLDCARLQQHRYQG